MTPARFNALVLDPGLQWLGSFAGPRMATPSARRLLLAIALQESGLAARCQTDDGPAHGFWQFERMGGVVGVLRHWSTFAWADRACIEATVENDPASVWRAIEGHDNLATAFARLLLYTDPAPLPVNDPLMAWNYYLRNWRPGKPRPTEWAANWAASALP